MTYGSGASGDYFNYDALGRVTSQWQVTGSGPTTYALSYGYNLAGMLTSETYPSGRAMSYAIGYGGKLSSVSDGSATFANNFSYDPGGGLSSETWGNTAVHTMSYNRELKASQVKLSINNLEKQRYDYLYGTVDQSTGGVTTSQNNGQIGRVDGYIDGSKQWDQRFSYDELGRLATAAEFQQGNNGNKTWQVQYTFDRWGNRFQSGSGNSGVSYSPVLSTDIDSATNHFIASGNTPISYDAAGNITSDMRFRGMTYGYDANNRQISAGSLQTSVYDCAGQRVQTTSWVPVTRTMVYDIFGQDVADYTGSTGGTLERENIYRGGGLFATYEPSSSTIKYVLQDIQGSARAVMNNNGTSSSITARHDFLPFGEEISSGMGLRSTSQGYGASDTNRQKYALTERDDTTGLDHTQFRKYESLSGRWTSPDSLLGNAADPQSFNRYPYTNSDPVDLFDPAGLEPSWNVCSPQFSSCGGGWDNGGSGYSGSPFDSDSFLFGGYGGLPPNIAAALARWDSIRTTGYDPVFDRFWGTYLVTYTDAQGKVVRSQELKNPTQYQLVISYLWAADLLRFVNGLIEEHGSGSSFHVTFQFLADPESKAAIMAILQNTKIFDSGPFGLEHMKDVGATNHKDFADFRSVNGVFGKGYPRSLEVAINTRKFQAYADIDRYNFYGGLWYSSLHLFVEYFPHKIKGLFK